MPHRIIKLLWVFLILQCSTTIWGQFNASVGIGMGYSAHADGYIEEQAIRIKEFSGYRMLIFSVAVKYDFQHGIGLFLRQEASPGVSTVSPYKYLSSLGGIQFKIPDSNVLLESGYGYNWTSALKQSQGKGALLSFGVGLQGGVGGLMLRWYGGANSSMHRERRLTVSLTYNLFRKDE